MGINTAAFTFFNAFVLRPLPVREPETLMRLNALDRNGRTHNFSIAEYRDIRDRNDVFAGVVALAPLPVSLGDAVAGRAATDYDIIPPGYEFAFGLTVSGQLFHGAWRSARARTAPGTGGRSHAAGTRGRGPERELLAQAVRRRPDARRPEHALQRPSLRGRRDRRQGVRRHSAERAGLLGSLGDARAIAGRSGG